jgi:isopentenyl-diphosphate Delta-isomerase
MSKTPDSPDFSELSQRKMDHINLTQKSKTSADAVDTRFDYEPMFFTHPGPNDTWPSSFLGFKLDFPIWVSSMTGGVEKSQIINQNLATLCGEFKLGMGLGSCRQLLTSSERLNDFQVRKYFGDGPLFANIGHAQLEELSLSNKFHLLDELIKTLEATGLIVHLNPLQEWFQPSGDRYRIDPLTTLKKFLEKTTYPVLIKEVGQGLGPKSLKAILDLPLAGIEFGAFGGTNFSLLESFRATDEIQYKRPFIQVGHTALEMVGILNALPDKGKEFIISGGIKTVLDGYELKTKLRAPSLIGMASNFLAPAQSNYENLREHFIQMKESLLVAKKILNLKGDL